MSTDRFVAAKILGTRLISEGSTADPALVSAKPPLKLVVEGGAEIQWLSPDLGAPGVPHRHESHLVIVPEITLTFVDSGTLATVITYTSKTEIRFEVSRYYGFDPYNDLPDDAIEPYLEMANWIVRANATRAVRQMGVVAFSWPTEADAISQESSD